MTPEQAKYVEILEAAGKRALGPGVAGVFVAVATTEGEMVVRWENPNQGVLRMLLLGLVEAGAHALRAQTLENFGKPGDAPTGTARSAAGGRKNLGPDDHALRDEEGFDLVAGIPRRSRDDRE